MPWKNVFQLYMFSGGWWNKSNEECFVVRNNLRIMQHAWHDCCQVGAHFWMKMTKKWVTTGRARESEKGWALRIYDVYRKIVDTIKSTLKVRQRNCLMNKTASHIFPYADTYSHSYTFLWVAQRWKRLCHDGKRFRLNTFGSFSLFTLQMCYAYKFRLCHH